MTTQRTFIVFIVFAQTKKGMRIKPFGQIRPRRILGLFGALILSIQCCSGQTTNILDWSGLWRYFDRGSLPATNWMMPDFDDSQWPEQHGLFGYPRLEITTTDFWMQTPMPYGHGLVPFSAYYFRTKITVPSDVLWLVAWNLIDDGAVFYVDGSEVGRIAMPAGPIEYETRSPRDAEVGLTGPEMLSLPNLAPGEHILAVEVHQAASQFVDTVFGMRLVGGVPFTGQSPTITRQPGSQTVYAAFPAMFSVEATGTAPLVYQWSTNGVAALGATARTYTTRPSTLEMNGMRVKVAVSNDFGRAESDEVTLRVIESGPGPKLVWASASASDRYVVGFDRQVVQSTASDPNNYYFLQVGTTNRVGVSNVQWGVSQVRMAPVGTLLIPGTDWVLVVNNVTDRDNVPIRPNSQIAMPVYLVLSNSVSAAWRWDASGRDLGTAWREVNYDDGDWTEGEGSFHYAMTPPTLSQMASSPLPASQGAYYFRKAFDLAALRPNATNVVLDLVHLIDDGAVFYLNGLEILRYRMPPEPIKRMSFARSNPEWGWTAVKLSPTNVVAGTNVLAVEVHNAGFGGPTGGATNSAAFGMSVSFTVTNAPVIPALHVVTSDNTATLTWSGSVYRLESAPVLEGPWENVETEAGQYVTAIGDTPRFFRLVTP